VPRSRKWYQGDPCSELLLEHLAVFGRRGLIVGPLERVKVTPFPEPVLLPAPLKLIRTADPAALAALLGALHGYLNGLAMAQAGPGSAGLLGIAAAVFAFVALATAGVVVLRAAWARVIVRVGGSWIAATGLLLLGWAFRSGS
jgi:hypothetical protein